MRTRTSCRLFAGLIALLTWTGLCVQGVVSYRLTGSLSLMLWTVLGYFTILANLLVAMVFTALALGRRVAPWVTAGTLLSIVLVGVTYALLLHGLLELSGGSAVANTLLHQVTPVLVPLFWFIFVRKGTLTWRHPLLWSILPLTYLPYALARGRASGQYAYPFLNVDRIGWTGVTWNALAISAAFLACAYGVLWLDRRLRPKSPA